MTLSIFCCVARRAYSPCPPALTRLLFLVFFFPLTFTCFITTVWFCAFSETLSFLAVRCCASRRGQEWACRFYGGRSLLPLRRRPSVPERDTERQRPVVYIAAFIQEILLPWLSFVAVPSLSALLASAGAEPKQTVRRAGALRANARQCPSAQRTDDFKGDHCSKKLRSEAL